MSVYGITSSSAILSPASEAFHSLQDRSSRDREEEREGALAQSSARSSGTPLGEPGDGHECWADPLTGEGVGKGGGGEKVTLWVRNLGGCCGQGRGNASEVARRSYRSRPPEPSAYVRDIDIDARLKSRQYLSNLQPSRKAAPSWLVL